MLLIACANVGKMLLARAAVRTQEIAIRCPVGADGPRIVRQIRLLYRAIPAALQPHQPQCVDATVLGFTALVALATGLLFGAAPAFAVARPNLAEALKDGARTSPRGGSRLRAWLVIGEVAPLPSACARIASCALRTIEVVREIEGSDKLMELQVNFGDPGRTGTTRAERNARRGCHSLHSNYMLNRGYAYTTIIGSKHPGQTLLSHLAGLYPHSTPQAWQQKLNNGEVTLNGVTATGRESVASGQTLVWNRPPWIEPDSPQHFEVLFEDPHLLAVNKPGGLPTLPGGGFMENTLLHLVQKQTPNANPVHRLGRGTSGIVLFAKTPQAASNLFANWNKPGIQKLYRALAQNIAQHDAYEILTPIGLVPHPLIVSVWAASPSGKPSKSLAKVISRSTSTTTFEVSLNSGRPHQIRIHLASIGHPLVGDPLYGVTGQPLENPGLPGDGGYALHAQFLKFRHPITGEQINLEAALPSGFSLHQ